MEDYDDLISLWNAARLEHKPYGRDSREKLAKELERGICIFLVAEVNNRIVGSVLGTHDGRKGWINRVAVHPEFQGRGLAQLLINRVEEKLYEIGIEIVACLIERSNFRSIKLFEKLGYKQHDEIVYLTKRKYPEV